MYMKYNIIRTCELMRWKMEMRITVTISLSAFMEKSEAERRNLQFEDL